MVTPPPTMLYMPPWTIYTPPFLPTGGTRPACSRASPHCSTRVLHFRLRHQQFPPSALRKETFPTSGITVPPRRNSSGTVKKPATESHRAQGTPECSDPSRSDRKPPSRLWAASSARDRGARIPLYSLAFLIKCDKSCQNGPSGHPIL